MPCLALTSLTLLTGCATRPSNTVIVCPSFVEYSPEFQGRAADELEKQPAGSALSVLVLDYLQLRDKIRECRRNAT